MRQLNSSQQDFSAQLAKALAWDDARSADITRAVADIINAVRTRGDAALLEYTQKFDDAKATLASLRVTEKEIDAAYAACDEIEREALEIAAQRIREYHAHQLPHNHEFTDALGNRLGWRWSAIDRAGLYVPGGLAAYPSSVLMNAIPAQVAGVKELAMVVPAPKGEIKPVVLVAAKIAGITEIYRAGGAQAISALAYGTAIIAPVDVIVGPGNAYVAEAKRQVFGKVGIDMIAGPSEIVVIADDSANPAWVAADLLSQAEHDEQARSILITPSSALAKSVEQAVASQLEHLPRRQIAQRSWDANGLIITCRNLEEAAQISNRIAPEHLELMVEHAENVAKSITHAGAIFMGHYTPEPIGDYMAGPSHVLPTSGSARFSSGLSVFNFLKRTSLIACTQEGFAGLAEATEALAEKEGLTAHARSVSLRRN